jgi:hypothetical protein
MAEIDAVEPERSPSSPTCCSRRRSCRQPGSGPDEDRFLAAVEHVNPGLARAA